MALTEQRRIFIDEYIKLRCKNATQAAINAGYSPKSAQSQSSQLLMDSNVIDYLEMRKKQIREELQQEFVFDALEARKVMFKILTNDESKDSDRLSAAKDFLDRAGFKPTDKVDVEHSGGLNIRNQYESMTEEELEELVKRYEKINST